MKTAGKLPSGFFMLYNRNIGVPFHKQDNSMKKILIVFALTLVLLFSLQADLIAEDWKTYTSKSSIFDVRIPVNAEETVTEFNLTRNSIAQTGTLVSTYDQRPYKDVVKTYMVKFEQTFGQTLTDEDISTLIREELAKYASHYSKLEGVQKDRKDLIFQGGIPGGEIYVEYKDPDLGEQSLRARFYFIRTGKITQLVSGPAEIMNSFQTRKYFESLSMAEGYARTSKKSDILTEWQFMDSPLGLFSAYLPSPVEPYLKKKAVFANSDTVERLSIEFYDPVWGDTLFYNIYGYKIPEKFTDLLMENLMRKKHILRHRFTAKKVVMKHFENNSIPGITAEYGIDPSDEHPHNNWVKLRAQYIGKYAIVHELIGTPRHVRSDFADYLISAVNFRPATAFIERQYSRSQENATEKQK